MKATLEFNLPEDRMEHLRAIKADDCFFALSEMANELYRPARKHGYSDPDLGKLNKYLESDKREMVIDIIELLEVKFFNILNDYGISLEDI